MAGAEPLERGPVALHRELVIGIAAGKFHRAADHDGRGAQIEPFAGMARQRAQERGEQILELVALPEYLRGVEGRACREGLERLDEAMDRASLEELLDRPRPALGARMQAGAGPFLPEAQRGDIDAMRAAAMLEANSLDTAVGIGQRDHGVAGAEIDANRDGGRSARHVMLGIWCERGRTFSGFGRACQPLPSAQNSRSGE
ncbi:hypothetical protein chiPu_0028224 [Chiloscyllium punctatum]|uniref:Uncharacterized protein n=1 Tax=Chiloscyllium punctatum TaxID=137246 RepID=A0A401TMR1_CHIPU|nr:hypothetical protein [Chiloscyllium punctatum]